MRKLDSAIFYSNDIPAIVTYYTQKIGLELEYQQGDKYASFLLADGIRLGIKKQSEEREIPGTQTIFLAVGDAKADFEKAKVAGLNIRKELTEAAWGLEFSVLDPDGNKVLFLQRKTV